jgi:hypothetical protein
VLVAVSATLYVVGREITPDYSGTALFGKTAVDTLSLKARLATAALALAGWQLLSALWVYGRLPWVGPRRLWLPTIHRGTSVLVDARIAIHSIAGCFFYGAFGAKVMVVRSERLPGWMLPAAGGLLIVLVAALWYTSALWYFNDLRIPLLD